jgi:hypothetical protein
MMRTIAGFILTFMLMGLAGCSYLQGYVDIAKDTGLSGKYLKTLEYWTRTKTVYSQFETQVRLSATLKNRAFNGAYSEEYGRVYALTGDEKKRRELVQADLASGYIEFFVYVYTPEKEINDFDRSNSIWKVFLLDGKGSRIDPFEVRRIDKVTPVMLEFFPYINRYYGVCYTMKFPRLAAAGGQSSEETSSLEEPIKLVFTGVIARLELKWP